LTGARPRAAGRTPAVAQAEPRDGRRHVGHHRLHLRIAGRDQQRILAALRRAQHSEPRRIDVVARAQRRERLAGHLDRDVDQWLLRGARAEVNDRRGDVAMLGEVAGAVAHGIAAGPAAEEDDRGAAALRLGRAQRAGERLADGRAGSGLARR
jgi:hypothetical protein